MGAAVSTTEKPQAVHKTVVGVCQTIEVDPETGWLKFNISHDGSQYPLKLSTKKPDLIALGQAVGKQTATWGYLESAGNPNPNKPGTFYMNRLFDSVQPLGLDQPERQDIAKTPQAPHPAEDPAAPPPAVDWDGKERRIVRQSCLKAAVTWCVGLEHVIEYATVTEVAAQFELWVYRAHVEYADAADLIADAAEDPDLQIPF